MKLPRLHSHLSVFLLSGTLLLSGCGQRASHGILSANLPDPAASPTPLSEAEREEKIETEVGKKIFNELPNREMSRKELTELAEKYREKARKQELEAEKAAREKQQAREKSDKPQGKSVPEATSKWPTPWPQSLPKPAPSASPLPIPQPLPIPLPKPQPTLEPTNPPKRTSIPFPWPLPENTGPEDSGIDAEDEASSETYSGPKEVVFRPQTSDRFNLSETAAQLAMLDRRQYVATQKDAMGSSYPACNFFVITSLFEAKVVDEDHLPMFTAASFAKNYLEPKSWTRVEFKTAEQWMREGRTFDVVIQKAPPAGKAHGHVAVVVGLNSQGIPLVAEGVYAKVTNRIRAYSREEISKYKVYVRY